MLAGAVLPPLTGTRALTAWQPAPLVDVALGLLGAAYLAAAWRVRRRHHRRPWPPQRTLAFLGGLAVAAGAVQGSPGVYDDVMFSAHMVQHVLLIMVAPPLLVWGRPVTLLMHSVGNPVHSWVKRAVRSRAVTVLSQPMAVTAIYAVVVAGTHTPPAMDLVVRNEAAHDAEHVAYLVSGCLFFLLIAGSEPIRWRIPVLGRYLMLLIAMQVDTVVGVVFMVAGHELFPPYSAAAPPWGPGPLTDLHRGGIVMWIGSDVVMVAIALMLSVALVRAPGAASHGAMPGYARGRDDASLAAYNSYLARLDRGHQLATGGTSFRPFASQPGGSAGPAPLRDLVQDRDEQRPDR